MPANTCTEKHAQTILLSSSARGELDCQHAPRDPPTIDLRPRANEPPPLLCSSCSSPGFKDDDAGYPIFRHREGLSFLIRPWTCFPRCSSAAAARRLLENVMVVWQRALAFSRTDPWWSCGVSRVLSLEPRLSRENQEKNQNVCTETRSYKEEGDADRLSVRERVWACGERSHSTLSLKREGESWLP